MHGFVVTYLSSPIVRYPFCPIGDAPRDLGRLLFPARNRFVDGLHKRPAESRSLAVRRPWLCISRVPVGAAFIAGFLLTAAGEVMWLRILATQKLPTMGRGADVAWPLQFLIVANGAPPAEERRFNSWPFLWPDEVQKNKLPKLRQQNRGCVLVNLEAHSIFRQFAVSPGEDELLSEVQRTMKPIFSDQDLTLYQASQGPGVSP